MGTGEVVARPSSLDEPLSGFVCVSFSSSTAGFASGAALHGAALHLEHGCSRSFDFWDARSEGIGLRSILAPTSGCLLCIRCDRCEPGVVRIDFGGMNTFSTRGAGGLLFAVVAHVSQELRCTRVVVRSPVQLRNNCAFPLQCLIYSPQAMPPRVWPRPIVMQPEARGFRCPKWVETCMHALMRCCCAQTAREKVLCVPPDAELSVPLALSTDMMVRVRPQHPPTDGSSALARCLLLSLPPHHSATSA